MRLEDDIAESGTPRFMIAAEAPIIIAKACEIFVLEVWMAFSGTWGAQGEGGASKIGISQGSISAFGKHFFLCFLPL